MSGKVKDFWQIKQAVAVLQQGGVIAYPTEAVYGLGCDPFDRHAVQRILQIKNRSVSKGLIVIASSIEQLETLVSIPSPAIQKKITASWPGHNTWILPARSNCPVWLTGEHSGLAVRVSAHKTCQALCDEFGPLVSTSANHSGKPAARTAWRSRMILRKDVDLILRGKTNPLASPSPIRDALTDQKWR